MARQYSHTQFFRRVPNSLLGEYFQKKYNVLHGIVFDKLKDSEVEKIFKAFTALSFDQQEKIEAELQDIDNMACQGGVTALTDEANYHQDQAFPEAIAKIEGFHGKVMWAFLEHPKYWEGATLFLHSDNIADSFWKKRNDLPNLPPQVDDENIERLAQDISHYFHSKEGRGKELQGGGLPAKRKRVFLCLP